MSDRRSSFMLASCSTCFGSEGSKFARPVNSAFPSAETASRSVEVIRAMSYDALATLGATAKPATTAACANTARRSGRPAAESDRAP